MGETHNDSYAKWAASPETQEAMQAASAAFMYRITAVNGSGNDDPDEHMDKVQAYFRSNMAGMAPPILSASARAAALAEEMNSPRPSTNRRVVLALLADQFFSINQTYDIATGLGKREVQGGPATRCVKDFLTWLEHQGHDPPLAEVMRVLLGMQQAGLLLSGGYQGSEQYLGQIFWSIDDDPMKTIGLTWLAEVFGGEVIIPTFNALTALITGKNGDGKELAGSGLTLSPWQLLTNRHVVEDIEHGMIVLPELPAQFGVGPLSSVARPHMEIPFHKSQITYETRDLEDIDNQPKDLDVDIAVITLPFGVFKPALDMHLRLAFRNPRWGDSAYVFGYPRVQGTTSGNEITVHSGKVVNPADDVRKLKVEFGDVVNPSAEVFDPRSKVFLYSAIARPGTSGGPIIAADGRVIGIVIESSLPAASTDDKHAATGEQSTSAPFYYGIPSGEVIRALNKLGVAGITATIEDWTD